MKPLDFVLTPKGAFAMVTETNGGGRRASITFIGPSLGEYNAWWNAADLKVLGNLPHLLASSTRHPFGEGQRDADRCFAPVRESPSPKSTDVGLDAGNAGDIE